LKCPLTVAGPTTERWFHGNISGKEAEALLLQNGRNGSFLMRESQNSPGDFAISARIDDKVTHVMVKKIDNKFDAGAGDQFDTLSDLVEQYRKAPMVDSNGVVVHLKYPLNTTRLSVADIVERVRELQKGEDGVSGKAGFWEEFEQLQSQGCKHLYSRKEGQKPENRVKNRYKNILPFDHTRIILQEPEPDNPGSDYINANRIQVLPEYDEFQGIDVSYISAQGSLPNTIDDFWRMVWQENTHVVVMMTKEVERTRTICVRYWPELGQTRICGRRKDLRLSQFAEESTFDYILRKFTLAKIDPSLPPQQQSNPQNTRIIYHYQFLGWPDHGVPSDPGVVLNFLEEVNRCQAAIPNAGPVVVHCSAGIGRTGTFIALDLILHLIKKHGMDCVIDIPRIVQMIRSQRSGMVQTEAQYRFVYMALLHYVDTVGKHIREHRRTELSGREYTNIKYTNDMNPGALPLSGAPSNGQLTPTSPSAHVAAAIADTRADSLIITPPAVALLHPGNNATPHNAASASSHTTTSSLFSRKSPDLKPLQLDPPPISKRLGRVKNVFGSKN